MDDESLIDEMRAALQADRARARKRRASGAPRQVMPVGDDPVSGDVARRGLLARLRRRPRSRVD